MVGIVERLRQTRADMLGTPDEAHYWDCVEAAAVIEKLRAALKPFAEYEYDDMDDDKDEIASPFILFKHIRAAAAALKETGDE